MWNRRRSGRDGSRDRTAESIHPPLALSMSLDFCQTFLIRVFTSTSSLTSYTRLEWKIQSYAGSLSIHLAWRQSLLVLCYLHINRYPCLRRGPLCCALGYKGELQSRIYNFSAFPSFITSEAPSVAILDASGEMNL